MQSVATLFPGKQKQQRKQSTISYLSDGLLVSHDSLLDECVHFNIPISTRHHHPGPAKTHRDFHGFSIRDLGSKTEKRRTRRRRRNPSGDKKGAWVCFVSVRLYSFREARTKGLSASPRWTTLFSMFFQTTCLASLTPSLSRSQSLSLSLCARSCAAFRCAREMLGNQR